MPANPHRSSLPRRLVLWVVGVVLTGRFVNNPSEYELRQMGGGRIVLSLLAFSVSIGLFWYVAFTMHTGIRNAILTYAIIAVSAASVPFVVQGCVARVVRYGEDLTRWATRVSGLSDGKMRRL